MRRLLAFATFLLLGALNAPTIASASDDTVPGDPVLGAKLDFLDAQQDASLFSVSGAQGNSPSEIYSRTQSVLEHFQVKPEVPFDFSAYESAQDRDAFSKIVSILDPNHQLTRYADVSATKVELFSDRDSKSLRETSVGFATSENHQSVRGLEAKLKQIAEQSHSALPLQGLKIALDPGHMGGKTWDALTGKFVRESSTGHTISEGVINLQTALLLEKRLKSLGAEVLITHRTLGTVSELPYEKLNIPEFARVELRESSLDSWFQNLLESHSPGNDLNSAFDSSSQVQALFSEQSRSHYYILKEDLDARSKMIEAYNADITLVIHYDAQVTSEEPNGVNPKNFDATKAFIPGAFMKTELATMEQRGNFARHALDPEAWTASYRLAHLAVKHISANLGIPKESPSGANQTTIEPGVIARNLALTRLLHSHAIAYVECLYYNSAKEFHAMEKTPHPLDIGGVNVPYSDRVALVAQSLGDAVLEFVQSYE